MFREPATNSDNTNLVISDQLHQQHTDPHPQFPHNLIHTYLLQLLSQMCQTNLKLSQITRAQPLINYSPEIPTVMAYNTEEIPSSYLQFKKSLTSPCYHPPEWSAQEGSPSVDVWQNNVLFWTCSLAPWQNLLRLHQRLSMRHTNTNKHIIQIQYNTCTMLLQSYDWGKKHNLTV